MAGYSPTPLSKKLGIKPGFRVNLRNVVDNYLDLISPIPEDITLSSRLRSDVDLWHVFTKQRQHLARELPIAMKAIRQNGMIWVSWPKKSSGVATDITEDVIRELALPMGLVDIKVCAVDDTWSGLKLVIRRSQRT